MQCSDMSKEKKKKKKKKKRQRQDARHHRAIACPVCVRALPGNVDARRQIHVSTVMATISLAEQVRRCFSPPPSLGIAKHIVTNVLAVVDGVKDALLFDMWPCTEPSQLAASVQFIVDAADKTAADAADGDDDDDKDVSEEQQSCAGFGGALLVLQLRYCETADSLPGEESSNTWSSLFVLNRPLFSTRGKRWTTDADFISDKQLIVVDAAKRSGPVRVPHHDAGLEQIAHAFSLISYSIDDFVVVGGGGGGDSEGSGYQTPTPKPKPDVPIITLDLNSETTPAVALHGALLEYPCVYRTDHHTTRNNLDMVSLALFEIKAMPTELHIKNMPLSGGDASGHAKSGGIPSKSSSGSFSSPVVLTSFSIPEDCCDGSEDELANALIKRIRERAQGKWFGEVSLSRRSVTLPSVSL